MKSRSKFLAISLAIVPILASLCASIVFADGTIVSEKPELLPTLGFDVISPNLSPPACTAGLISGAQNAIQTVMMQKQMPSATGAPSTSLMAGACAMPDFSCPVSTQNNMNYGGFPMPLQCGYSEKQFVQFQEMTQNISMCLTACKKTKLDAAEADLLCFQSNISAFERELDLVSQDYQGKLHAQLKTVQEKVQEMTANSTNMGAQIEDIQSKLNANDKTGNPGLLELKKKTDKVMKSMPPQIANFETDQKNTDHWEKVLTEQIQYHTIAKTMDCFQNQPMTGTDIGQASLPPQCRSTDESPATPLALVLCLYEQKLQLGKTTVRGQERTILERDRFTQNQASRKKRGLEVDLDLLLKNTPKDARIPTTNDPKELNTYAEQKILYSSMDDIKKYIDENLTRYPMGKSNAAAFVTGRLNVCNRRAVKEIQADSKSSSHGIGFAKKELATKKRSVQTDYTALFNLYNDQYTESVAGLSLLMTGQKPLNPALKDGCSNQPINKLPKCLKEVQQKMASLYNGQSFQETTMAVKGTKDTLSISCRGLSDCVTQLQAKADSVDKKKKHLDETKKNHILNVNRAARTITLNTAKKLSGRNEMLRNRLTELTGKLGAIDINLKTPADLKEEDLVDAEGRSLNDKNADLLKEPGNARFALAKFSQPKLLDTSNTGIREALISLSQKKSSVQMEEKQVFMQRMQLVTQSANCDSSRDQARMQSEQQRLQGLMANCSTIPGMERELNQLMTTSIYTADSLRAHPPQGMNMNPMAMGGMGMGMGGMGMGGMMMPGMGGMYGMPGMYGGYPMQGGYNRPAEYDKDGVLIQGTGTPGVDPIRKGDPAGRVGENVKPASEQYCRSSLATAKDLSFKGQDDIRRNQLKFSGAANRPLF